MIDEEEGTTDEGCDEISCGDCIFFEGDNKWCGKLGIKVLSISNGCLNYIEGWGGDIDC